MSERLMEIHSNPPKLYYGFNVHVSLEVSMVMGFTMYL